MTATIRRQLGFDPAIFSDILVSKPDTYKDSTRYFSVIFKIFEIHP